MFTALESKWRSLPTCIIQHILSFFDHHPAVTCLDAPKEYREWLTFWLQYYPELAYDYYAAHFPRYLTKANCYHCKGAFKAIQHPLFDYLSQRPGLVIAGGFATQIYLGRVPETTSDIDIFILNEGEIKPLLNFARALGVKYVEAFKGICSVIQFQVPALEYVVQLIYTETKSVSGIMRAFDSSHCKCFIYGGNIYAAPDAKLSFEKRRAVAYKDLRLCRVRKALKYVDSFVNLEASNLSEVCCTKLNTITVPIEDIHMSCWDIDKYCATNHKCVARVVVKRRVNIESNFCRSPLEKLANVQLIPTFKLYFNRPEYIVDSMVYFYTKDKRVNILYKFWVSLAGALEVIEGDAWRWWVQTQRHRGGSRRRFFTPKLLIKPIGHCDERLLSNHRGGVRHDCTGHPEWTTLVLCCPRQLCDGEYELDLIFTRRKVIIGGFI